MKKLFEFLRSVHVPVLFVLLELVAINYYARSSHYTQAKLLTRSNQIVGGTRSLVTGIRHYFSLGRENRELLERMAQLEGELARYKEAEVEARLADYLVEPGAAQYHFSVASVVSNSTNRMQNFLTLNRGRAHGVMTQMALLSPNGEMVGYVADCSERYSVAVSILNTSFRASGKLAKSEHLGSIYWDGVNPHEVILGELSKYAEPQPGDEVVSAGISSYFPQDILIGWVEEAELNETRTSYTVRVRLAADISAQNSVVLVCDQDQWEKRSLQQPEMNESYIDTD